MEFALSQEQVLFADSLRGLLELGLPGLLVPERFGGAGLGIVDAAVAAEVIGGAAGFAPFAGSVVMATLAFTHGATEELQDAWLPRIAAGEVRFGVGFGRALTLSGDRLS